MHIPIGIQTVSQAATAPTTRSGNMRFESALDFLDQVKMQFQDNPVIYNQFLDVMKEFKNQKYFHFIAPR